MEKQGGTAQTPKRKGMQTRSCGPVEDQQQQHNSPTTPPHSSAATQASELAAEGDRVEVMEVDEGGGDGGAGAPGIGIGLTLEVGGGGNADRSSGAAEVASSSFEEDPAWGKRARTDCNADTVHDGQVVGSTASVPPSDQQAEKVEKMRKEMKRCLNPECQDEKQSLQRQLDDLRRQLETSQSQLKKKEKECDEKNEELDMVLSEIIRLMSRPTIYIQSVIERCRSSGRPIPPILALVEAELSNQGSGPPRDPEPSNTSAETATLSRIIEQSQPSDNVNEEIDNTESNEENGSEQGSI